jgi:hypothetical protein
MFLNSYKYQEIAHIYLQDNLFGVVDIAFTSNKKWRNRNPLKDMGDIWYSRRAKSFCSLSGNRHA